MQYKVDRVDAWIGWAGGWVGAEAVVSSSEEVREKGSGQGGECTKRRRNLQPEHDAVAELRVDAAAQPAAHVDAAREEHVVVAEVRAELVRAWHRCSMGANRQP